MMELVLKKKKKKSKIMEKDMKTKNKGMKELYHYRDVTGDWKFSDTTPGIFSRLIPGVMASRVTCARFMEGLCKESETSCHFRHIRCPVAYYVTDLYKIKDVGKSKADEIKRKFVPLRYIVKKVYPVDETDKKDRSYADVLRKGLKLNAMIQDLIKELDKPKRKKEEKTVEVVLPKKEENAEKKEEPKKEEPKKVVSSKKSSKNNDDPIRARSAYNLFTIDVSKELAGQKFERGGLLKEVANRWKKITEKEKEKYEEMAAEEKKKLGLNPSKSKGSKRSVSIRDTKKGKRIIDDDEEETHTEDKE